MQVLGRPSARNRLLVMASMAVLTGMLTTGASAAALDGSNLAPDFEPSCTSRLMPTAPPVALMAGQAPISKSSAILGGQPSALDRIRLAQDNAASSTIASSAVAEAAGAAPLQPAAGGLRWQPDSCSSALVSSMPGPQGSEDFLASKRLKVSRTIFDRDWTRVNAERISKARFQRLVGVVDTDTPALMATVNRWVNRTIAFTDDRQLFGKADFWAGARKTLALGRGDCEDIALTKMELLAAAGVRREDMILTIAKDLVRNADHAVLIVRHDDRFYLLDNNADEVLEGSASHDYRPIFSYGAGQAWIHGY